MVAQKKDDLVLSNCLDTACCALCSICCCPSVTGHLNRPAHRTLWGKAGGFVSRPRTSSRCYAGLSKPFKLLKMYQPEVCTV
jgi:hypothetical protein